MYWIVTGVVWISMRTDPARGGQNALHSVIRLLKAAENAASHHNRAADELICAGIEEPIGTVLADGGYCNSPQITELRARDIDVLVPAKNHRRTTPRQSLTRQGDEARRIEAILDTPEGRALYRRRQQIVESVFANTKFLRRIDRFQRRGLRACQAEWHLIAATHNLLKLWRARQSPAAA